MAEEKPRGKHMRVVDTGDESAPVGKHAKPQEDVPEKPTSAKPAPSHAAVPDSAAPMESASSQVAVPAPAAPSHVAVPDPAVPIQVEAAPAEPATPAVPEPAAPATPAPAQVPTPAAPVNPVPAQAVPSVQVPSPAEPATSATPAPAQVPTPAEPVPVQSPAPTQVVPPLQVPTASRPNEEAPNQNTQKPKDKKAKRKGGNLLSNLLIIVGVALLLVAAGIYGYNWWNYHQIDEGNERVAEYAKLSSDDDTPPEVDWDALKAMNPDVVGWLQVPGTIVNYPVFQTSDNEYYLDHAPDRSQSIGGAVFMDYECKAPGMVDAQTIIYGHHMRNGSQFKQIADMDDQALFDGISTVWYVTEQNNYKLAPLFLYYTSEDDLEVRQFSFQSDEEWRAYLQTYLSKAVTKRADAEQVIQKVSHVLTLSTCNYYDGYGRTLLVCVPQSELEG